MQAYPVASAVIGGLYPLLKVVPVPGCELVNRYSGSFKGIYNLSVLSVFAVRNKVWLDSKIDLCYPLTPTLSPKGRGREKSAIFMFRGVSMGHECLFRVWDLTNMYHVSCVLHPD